MDNKITLHSIRIKQRNTHVKISSNIEIEVVKYVDDVIIPL